MNKSTKFRIVICILMLGAAACVLLGKSVMSFSGGFSLGYKYLDGLFPSEGTVFRSWFSEYLWIVLIAGVLTAVLVWIRKAFMPILCMILCLVPIGYYIVQNLILGYNPLEFEGIWDVCMKLFPIISAILCFMLHRAQREE